MTNEWSFFLAVVTAIVTAAAGIVLTTINQRTQQRIAREQQRIDRQQQDIKEAARRADAYITEERIHRAEESAAATALRHELRNDNQVLRIEITSLRAEFELCRQKFILGEHKIWTMDQELNVLRKRLGLGEIAVNPEPPVGG